MGPRPRSALAALILVLRNAPSRSSFVAMTWKDTWADILSGGSPRWKVDDPAAKEAALRRIVAEHRSPSSSSSSGDDDDGDDGGGRPLRILCPLAGDDPFVRTAWSAGHDVTAVDVVPAALEAMRSQFGDGPGDWTSDDDGGDDDGAGAGRTWRHRSGRVALVEGDVLTKRPGWTGRFDVVYDKDAFGALPPNARPQYCARVAEWHGEGGTLYVEVKNKASGRESGPPFHVEKEDLMAGTAFGPWYEHVRSLGEVYPLTMPGMTQTGHILRRVAKR